MAIGVVAGVLFFLLQKYYRDKARKDVRCKKVILHADTRHDGKSVERLMSALWEGRRPWFTRLIWGREWIQLLIHSKRGEHPEGDIYFYIAYQQDRDPYIKKEVLNVYPNVELIDVPHEEFPQPFLNKGFGGKLDWQYPKQPELPLHTFDGSETISNILTHLDPGTYVSLIFSPVSAKKLNEQIEITRDTVIHGEKGNKWAFLQPYIDATLKAFNKDVSQGKQEQVYSDDVKATLDKLRKRHESQSPAFDVEIFVWHEADDRRPVDSLVNAINTTVKKENRLKLVETKKSPFDLAPYPRASKAMTWTGLELGISFIFQRGKLDMRRKIGFHISWTVSLM